MQLFIKKMPYAISGLCLGIVSLATVVKGWGFILLGNSLAFVSAIMVLCVLFKVLTQWTIVKKEFENIGVASTAPTLTMAIELLLTFLLPFRFLYPFLFGMWLFTVFIHFLLMAYFVYHFFILPKKSWAIVYPSWFVILVGIGVITVTSGPFLPMLGKGMFYLGLLFYFIALPFVLYRVFIYKRIPKPAQALTTIIAAPGSLLLAGYFAAFQPKTSIVLFLFFLSQLFYFIALKLVWNTMTLPFYPSFSGFTFPLVISAKAAQGMINYVAVHASFDVGFFRVLAILESGIAVTIVLYVFTLYSIFLFGKKE